VKTEETGIFSSMSAFYVNSKQAILVADNSLLMDSGSCIFYPYDGSWVFICCYGILYLVE
jgi:hypothetical protein